MNRLLVSVLLAVCASALFADDVEDHVNDIWRRMMADRWSPKTGLIYSTKPENVKPAREFKNGLFRWSKENKEGYGRGMSDCSIVSGIGLAGLCDAYAVTKDEKLRAEAKRVAKGLISNATAHGFKGFVARGVCEEDGRSICALSSIDQFTHWFHGLWHYAASPLASAEDRKQVAGLFVDVLERIGRVATPANGYNFGQADGAPDPRGICGVWSDKPAKEWGSVHGATRLPMFYLATWNLTGDAQWKAKYDAIVDKALAVNLRLRDEDPHQWRWVMPTYSLLQMACANDVLYTLETDPRRKALFADCLRAGAKVADGRAKDMLKNPEKKWYGMCPDAELALAMVYSPDFDFDADECGILRDRILKQSPWNSLAVTHYYGAYWRARRRGISLNPEKPASATDFRPTVRKDGFAAFGGLVGKPTLVIGPGWSRTVTTGTVAFASAPAGGWTMKVRAAYPADATFTSTYFDLTIPISYRRFALDGVEKEFPAEKKKPFLGDGKTSFAIYLPSGDKVTFTGVRAHVEDGRCWNAKSYMVRFYFTRTDADGMANFALDCGVSVERVAGKLRDFCRVPQGVPDFASATCAEGPDWIVTDFNRETKPGSPLDFSQLEFKAPGGKVRYFGGNCSWSAAFLEKEESDRVADEVKRLGYNIVRAHQHDTQFLPKGAQRSTEIDPAAFDRFDYFVAAMKKRGIAFTTDCYSSRKFLATDPGLADVANSFREMKAALAVRPEAMANWKAFTRAFLCHVNPYTGLALKDDPTLVCLNLVNEDNYELGICKGMRLLKESRKDFKTDLDWERFLAEKQQEIHREQYDFVKKELGVKAPVTSLNMCSGVDYCARRSRFDLVDLHMYYAHPTYWDPTGVRYPHAFNSQLGQEGQGMIMLGNFFQRDWTRPCFSTEYRHCAPNVFRSECGALVGAYAALQDWQGLVGYGYAEGAYSFRGTPTIHNPFDTASDPVALMMDRQTALLFRRGDVKPARGRLALEVPAGELFPTNLPRHLSRAVRELGLQTGVGFVSGAAPAGVSVAAYADVTNRAARLAAEPVVASDTEELFFDRSNRVFKAVTDRSEVLLASFGSASAKSFSAEVLDEGAAALSLHALDDAAIARSEKLLFFHLTDSVNDGTEFEDGLLRRERKAGKGRVLIRRQRVRVKFGFPVTKVTALKCDGAAAGEVSPEADGSYVLRTDAFAGGVLAYAITRPAAGSVKVGTAAFRGIKPALWQGISIYRDIPYGPRGDQPGEGKGYTSALTGKTDDGRWYHTHRTGQFCDLIVPTRGYAANAPVFVNFHGGAWCQASDKDGESLDYLRRYAERGFIVINADYMMPMDLLDNTRKVVKTPNATYRDMLRDIDTLASFLKYDLLPSIGVKPTKFGIGGGSAGGHLATLYGYDQANPAHLDAGLRHDYPVAFVVDVVGPTDLASEDFTKPFLKKDTSGCMFDEWAIDRLVTLLGWLTEDDLRGRIAKNDLDGVRRTLARYSPNRMVTKDTPPTVLAYCRTHPWSETDGCVPTSTYDDLMAKLEAAKVPHHGDLRSWRIHGWLRDGFTDWVVARAAEFAKQYIR